MTRALVRLSQFARPALGVGWAMVIVVAAVPGTGSAAIPFSFSKTIERPTTGEEEIVAVELDSELYAATRDGLPDVRIVDGDQADTPFVLEQHTGRQVQRTRRSFAAETVSLREQGDAIEIHVRRPRNAPTVDGISLLTPLRDFERHLRVRGSKDGTDWQPLADGFLFDYTRYMDVSQREIDVPENDYQDFQITIEEVTDERESPYRELTRTLKQGQEEQRVEQTVRERRPLRIDQITFWRDEASERPDAPVRRSYPVSIVTTSADDDAKTTLILLKAQRQPLTQFTLETSSRNFSRSLVVQVPEPQGPRTAWRDVAQGMISKLQFRGIDRSQLTVTFPEQRQTEYRLVIRNEDNPPLEVTGVQARGNVYRLVFLARPGTEYRVRYGSRAAETPRYETATVLSALRRDQAETTATLGAEVASDERVETIQIRDLLDNPWLLGTAVCLVVIVLGWGLFRAASRLPSDEPDTTAGGVGEPKDAGP